MNAAEVKEALRRRYPAAGQMGSRRIPGPWTCVEEWAGIDLLAIGATTGAARHAWIGHEVKVSRGDLRSELLNPRKRDPYKARCHQLYLAVPDGLLTAAEIAWTEPDWRAGDFERAICPACQNHRVQRETRKAYGWPPRGALERVPVPVDLSTDQWLSEWTMVVCRSCGGSGAAELSVVERTAPTLWVPRDVGLIVVSAKGRCREVKPAPRRRTIEQLDHRDIANLVRWVSARPDPRHNGLIEETRAHARAEAARYRGVA